MDRDRQYLRPRMGGAGTSTSRTISEDRFSSRMAEWSDREQDARERDSLSTTMTMSSQRGQPVKSILRKPMSPPMSPPPPMSRLTTRPRRNSDTSITSSNTPAVGSDSELGSPSHMKSALVPSSGSTSTSTLPRKVLKAKFSGVPEERRGMVNLRSSRASNTSIPSSYHIPPVRSILAPPPHAQYLDSRFGDRRESHDYHRDDRSHDRDHDRDRDRDRDPDTESVSESSDLSASTHATTVASVESDCETDVTPTETIPRSTQSQVRFTPSVIGSGSSVASSTPPSRKVKPRLGTRARPASEADRTVARNGGRTVQDSHADDSDARTVTTQQELKKSQKELETMKTQRDVERSLLQKIEQLEADTKQLREGRAKLEQELGDHSSRLLATSRDKDAAEKERDRERNHKDEVVFKLEEQKAILDEYRSNFELQQAMLDEMDKEREAEREAALHLCPAKGHAYRVGKGTRRNRRGQGEARGQDRVTRDALLEQRDNRDKEILELSAARDQLQADSTTLAAQVATLTDEKKAAEDEQQKIRDAAKEEQDSLKKAAEEEQQKMKTGAEEEQQKLKDAAEEAQQAIKTRVDELEKEKGELEQAKGTLEGEKADLQAKLETAEGQITSLTARVDELESASSDLTARLTSTEDELTALKASATDLENQVATLQSDKTSLQQQLDDVAAAKADLQSQFDSLNTALAGTKAANISLASQKLEISGDMTSMQASLDAARAEVDKLTADNTAALEAAAADKAAALETANAAAVDLASKISTLEAQISSLQAEADKIPTLESQIPALEATIASLQSDADKLPALQAEISALQATITALQTQLSEQQQQHQEQLEQLQQQQQQQPPPPPASEDTAALQTELEATRASLTQRMDEIASLAAGNTALTAQLATTTQQLSTAQQSFETLTTSYNAAASQVIDLQQRVEQLVAMSSGSRRGGSRSRNSSPQKNKDGSKADGRKSGLVVVRNPGDRGAVSVMLQIAAGI
ncbi:hypothetical protein B0T22DRAFT_388344 [Podospora appendiculata]|uniref:Myosin heavy chain n=1 Tax=Podospora appendiculata TaxID=314037 RepID=A0AAE1C774_9PEZI|nr:hypothetical protein B0T22DRAFT_388344 [Podospora appendiculata]